MTASSGGVLGLIPARAGSKGIPGKNTRLLGGRPLLAYSVDAGRDSGVVDRLILSTDDPDIAAVGRAEGIEVPFIRPAVLAADDSAMFDVVRHAVEALADSGWAAEIVVLLQPTSPLRVPARIREAVTILRKTDDDSVVTVVELPRHHSPDYVMKVVNGKLEPFLAEGTRVTRRQDARPAYVRDGSVYAFWRKTLVDYGDIYGRICRPLVIPSSEAVTLDLPDDWDVAERMLHGRRATLGETDVADGARGAPA